MSPDAYQEMAKTESLHWWFLGRRSIIASTLNSFSLKKDAKILEVGCGTGGNLEMLRCFGKVSAFEMDKVAYDIALEKSKNLCDIRMGFCPDEIPFTEERFDLICMFDVLEHIQEDRQTLVKLKTLLKPEGRILITVPAYQWLFGAHDIFLHHKRRYTAGQLLDLVNLAGFKLIKLSYFNTILFPLAVIARLKDKILKSSLASGTEIPGKIINEIFKHLFSFERHLLRVFNLPFGVSLIGIFQAKDL